MEATQNNDRQKVVSLFMQMRKTTGVSSFGRTKVINQNLKTILEMLFSPLAKYLLFSSQSEKGLFNNFIHSEEFTSG